MSTRIPDRSTNRSIDKQMISRHVALQAELVEKRLLHHRPFAHHQLNLPLRKTESGLYTASNAASFNDIRHFATFMALIQSGPSRYGLKRAIVLKKSDLKQC